MEDQAEDGIGALDYDEDNVSIMGGVDSSGSTTVVTVDSYDKTNDIIQKQNDVIKKHLASYQKWHENEMEYKEQIKQLKATVASTQSSEMVAVSKFMELQTSFDNSAQLQKREIKILNNEIARLRANLKVTGPGGPDSKRKRHSTDNESNQSGDSGMSSPCDRGETSAGRFGNALGMELCDGETPTNNGRSRRRGSSPAITRHNGSTGIMISLSRSETQPARAVMPASSSVSSKFTQTKAKSIVTDLCDAMEDVCMDEDDATILKGDLTTSSFTDTSVQLCRDQSHDFRSGCHEIFHCAACDVHVVQCDYMRHVAAMTHKLKAQRMMSASSPPPPTSKPPSTKQPIVITLA